MAYNNGFLKLHRSMLEWEWYTDGNTFRLFMHILMKANWKDKKFKGIEVPEGSFITSQDHLAKELKMSRQSVRTALNHLISTNEITKSTKGCYTLITVNNWKLYQSELTSFSTNDQPSANQVLTTTEERKERKNKKNNLSTFPTRDYDFADLEKRLMDSQ